MTDKSFASWLEIDTSAFLKNIQAIKKLIPEGVQLMLILKANAYGHGAAIMAKVAEANGESHFGVARIEEALELRRAGIKSHIYLLSGVPIRCVDKIVENNLACSIGEINFAKSLNEASKKVGKIIPIHIKIDSGMNRFGFKLKDLDQALIVLKSLKNLEITGVFSHLADCNNKDFTHMQFSFFDNALKIFQQNGLDISKLTKHILNSDGVSLFSQYHYDMVRVGRSLYDFKQPVLTFKTQISLIKEIKKGESVGYGCSYKASKNIKAAVLMCGYADGLNRNLSNRGYVIIKGLRCPFIGRISMDQSVVDITNVSNISINDEVIIPLSDYVDLGDTIIYEIWTSISSRVKRIYF